MEVSRTRETVSTVEEKEAVIKTEKIEISADFHGVLRVQAKESDPDIDRGMTVSPGLTEVLCEVIIVLVSTPGRTEASCDVSPREEGREKGTHSRTG